MKQSKSVVMESMVARLFIAKMASVLVTSATFVSLITYFSRVAHAAPVSWAAGRPQSISPPSTQYPPPQPCLGNCSMMNDPNVVYENDTYWRFSAQDNIPVATASSLEGPWTYQGDLPHDGANIHVRDDQEVWVRCNLRKR